MDHRSSLTQNRGPSHGTHDPARRKRSRQKRSAAATTEV